MAERRKEARRISARPRPGWGFSHITMSCTQKPPGIANAGSGNSGSHRTTRILR